MAGGGVGRGGRERGGVQNVLSCVANRALEVLTFTLTMTRR